MGKESGVSAQQRRFGCAERPGPDSIRPDYSSFNLEVGGFGE
jgi:hypothetical protein